MGQFGFFIGRAFHERRLAAMNIREIPMLTALCVLFFITGCGLSPVAMLAGDLTKVKGKASGALSLNDCNEENIQETVCEIGKSLGYRIARESAYEVHLFYSKSEIEEFITGSRKTSSIFIDIFPNRVKIRVMTSGDFGTGGDEYANKVLNDFKDRLLERLSKKNDKEA
jgi:hypothetical protein